ncbi:hypothetical protein JHK85_001589 [Glycine max]|nr:hypothetical protein JHK85_001589 [Glycine max]
MDQQKTFILSDKKFLPSLFASAFSSSCPNILEPRNILVPQDIEKRFKDHRRCSYMIANALDKDGKFTTGQVSRKLKQLDLYLPLPKDGKFTTAQGVLLLN